MQLSVIGLGKMGSTLIQGILAAEILKPAQIVGCDLKVEERESNSNYGGIKTVNNNIAGVKGADVILLAVKPQVIEEVLKEIKEQIAGKLIISIAAGITIDDIKNKLPASTRVIRVMPNTPALVKEGASAFTPGGQATEEDKQLVKEILTGVGKVIEVKEELMNTVTGLSGSGPAYVYLMIEALADGGVLKGLSRENSLQLAAQTVMGAAKMVLETGNHPGELKDMVTSPGGTTINGIEALESQGFRGILIDAVKKASERSEELNSES